MKAGAQTGTSRKVSRLCWPDLVRSTRFFFGVNKNLITTKAQPIMVRCAHQKQVLTVHRQFIAAYQVRHVSLF